MNTEQEGYDVGTEIISRMDGWMDGWRAELHDIDRAGQMDGEDKQAMC